MPHSRFARYLFAAVVLTCALAFSSQAQEPSKSSREIPNFGLYALPKSNQDPFLQDVLCDTLFACQFPDPMFDFAPQPAIGFSTDMDSIVHIEADIYGALDCNDSNFMGTAMGDLAIPAGDAIVFLRFDPPLDIGTTISLKWRVGPPDAPCMLDPVCTNYIIGSDPPSCVAKPEGKK